MTLAKPVMRGLLVMRTRIVLPLGFAMCLGMIGGLKVSTALYRSRSLLSPHQSLSYNSALYSCRRCNMVLHSASEIMSIGKLTSPTSLIIHEHIGETQQVDYELTRLCNRQRHPLWATPVT